jgi:hypothetical protein
LINVRPSGVESPRPTETLEPSLQDSPATCQLELWVPLSELCCSPKETELDLFKSDYFKHFFLSITISISQIITVQMWNLSFINKVQINK